MPAAALLVLVTASPAAAAVTVNPGGSVLGDGANDNISVSCTGGQLTASGMTAGDACATLTNLYVSPGAGGDTVDLGSLTPALLPAITDATVSTEEIGAAEADSVAGSGLSEYYYGDHLDSINAGGGDDLINGADSASGGAGNDTFLAIDFLASGGEGDDRFIQFAPTGGLDGGPGVDSWELDFDQATIGAPNTTISFVMSAAGLSVDIAEDLAPAQVVPASGLDQVFFTMLRLGAQTYAGADFPGTQHVRGFAGPDAITGGGQDDALYGGPGNDAIVGGLGADVLHGGDDNDTINARDGVADRIDCGAGTDSVVADAVDVLANCETVDQPAVAAPPAPPAQVVLVPVVPVTNAVTGPAKVKKGRTGAFKFSSPTGGATFQCQLDNGAWKACASAYKVRTKKLKLGKHTLLVRALVSGAADATPSRKTFKVVKG